VGIVELLVGPGKPAPADQLHLIPKPFNRSKALARAIHRYVESWSEGIIRSRAVDDLLHRRPPRILGFAGGALIAESGDLTASVIDLVGRLDESVLCIQGPPGTGKTYTCAAVIAQLLKQGKSVGVTANSHKAIMNVMRMI